MLILESVLEFYIIDGIMEGFVDKVGVMVFVVDGYGWVKYFISILDVVGIDDEMIDGVELIPEIDGLTVVELLKIDELVF